MGSVCLRWIPTYPVPRPEIATALAPVPYDDQPPHPTSGSVPVNVQTNPFTGSSEEPASSHSFHLSPHAGISLQSSSHAHQDTIIEYLGRIRGPETLRAPPV
jgi:hypothetical protein